MTIIEPNKNKFNLGSGLVLLVAVLITSAVFSIRLYNQNVNLKHSVNVNLKMIQNLQVANADYKNKLYNILNPQNIELITKEKNLVPEKQPGYLQENGDILARN